MKLTAEMVESMAGLFLSPRYDQPQPTPEFHRECWRRYCSDAPAAATAAPRNHAKSTALTHDFILAMVLFRVEQYVIIVSSSEELAIEHLSDIANEFRENDELIQEFMIEEIISDQKTDLTIRCRDDYYFRIIARGAEQKMRGRKWRGRRPGLIVCDDLEDDEQVSNRDRRKKFRQWFFRACKQALRDGGKIRVHGTILHIDSLLSHLIKNPTWFSKCYRAHRGFSEFTEILWPEKFPEARLRQIQCEMVAEGDSAGYSQEYLNDPRDDENAYLQRGDLLEMSLGDHDKFKLFYVGCDFSITKKSYSNRTSFTVGGRDPDNIVYIVDQYKGRWGTLEIIEKMFEIQARWTPQSFFVEKGQIWAAIGPIVRNEMLRRDVFLHITELPSVEDKALRGRPLQKRTRAGAMKFDKSATWYPEYEDEILSFTPNSEAVLDDQFDSTTELIRGLEQTAQVDEEDSYTEEEREFDRLAFLARGGPTSGRSKVTGY